MLELLMNNYQTFVSKLAYQAKGLSRLAKLRNTIAQKLPRSCISSLDMLKTIDQNQAKIIYDIGANVGTWSLLAKAVFPHIEVNIITLDEYILINNLPFPDLIKLDVQGYELEVLKGAQNCLNHAKWILCEVSFQEYYHQQPLFHHIANFLDDYGYRVELLGNDNIFMTPCTQMDVLFYRY